MYLSGYTIKASRISDNVIDDQRESENCSCIMISLYSTLNIFELVKGKYKDAI
jgi:hypothetical protein